ncbi:DoxX family protein [Hymenobacter sp. 15J16-1T3B]|uniref:DoxX family protein n=1 Tax=Hymenobacter sp. 15J16-1T3B TaxID=2886941 RepID=UPI001D0F9C43|nr:DoxX family protein [Hymenobacter sp. 15J16-1T3B]MCC3159313.1 DoxX family protein [Hymenobacter sp. 15J16-1T3B]
MKKLLFSATALPSLPTDVAWLLFRLHLGLSIALGAGWSKLVNLSTTRDLDKLLVDPGQLGTPDWFVQQVAGLGFTFPSPYFWAAAAVWGEFVGGLLIAAGLLSRWSALQLAVQFLVIAFFWYEHPEPLVGMYYQQLLFWAFVAVVAVGPGRYSLDYWLTQARPERATPAGLAVRGAVAVLALGLLTSATRAGEVHSDLLLAPGKVFVLGGGQEAAFRVAAHNVGQAAVDVQERGADGQLGTSSVLAPGARTMLRFAAGSAAILTNATPAQARLSLRISGGAGLGMRYESDANRPATSVFPTSDPQGAVFRAADFRPLVGYDWLGTLTYRDYQSQRPVTLRTRLNGMQAGPQELVLDYQYQEPEGGMVKGFERLRLRPDGRGVEWDGLPMRLELRQLLPDSTVQLVLLGEGQDDNRPAAIRRTVLLAPRQCSIRKDVRFAGQAEWLQRHEYRFSR